MCEKHGDGWALDEGEGDRQDIRIIDEMHELGEALEKSKERRTRLRTTEEHKDYRSCPESLFRKDDDDAYALDDDDYIVEAE